jgi:2-C-methyl-D-erythritol 4-phosphate cytidylyltransferase/2-C-methyl-D-erythritol 2,4-cyclodiphosphate synthase
MGQSRTTALIVAAGQGVRTGAAIPKQFARLSGKPVIAHSYHALSSHPAIDQVLIVIGEGQQQSLSDALGNVDFVIGGATRRESVRNGLEALAPDAPANILVHDAARPLLSHGVIDRLLAALEHHDAAMPVLPVADTLVTSNGDTAGDVVSREALCRVQTPQAFEFATLYDAHRRWPSTSEATDDAQMVRAMGGDVHLVRGDTMLEKITTAADFHTAELRLGTPLQVRSAQGFDVHRFEVGKELWLGGVLIPHDKGLSGHSDAGGAGDIGLHFPPSDPKWRGAASTQFLQHAAGLVAARGGVIDFIDVTLMCEAPKIGPHRKAIRANVAQILGLPADAVSVKATTTERLGFTGRGEGMAAQAIATVRLPSPLLP